MAGEELHERGAEGTRRAKRWLDRTTRAEARWVTPDATAVPKLTFPWASGGDFSFDLGGLLRGGGLEGQLFLTECKFYKQPSGQGTMYEEFLAKCYRAFVVRPPMCDNFMWITWAPFKSTTWAQLTSRETIREAVVKYRTKALNVADEAQARGAIDEAALDAVSQGLWVIVLSERQEQELVMSSDHLALINAHETQRSA